MFGKSSNDIYKRLISKTLALAAVIESGDSNVKRVIHRDYDTNTEPEYNTSENGRILTSTGDIVKMHDFGLETYNVLTNIVLYGITTPEISKSSTRFASGKESLLVYINGVKVPDSDIYLYCTQSNTNIVIPKIYFEDGMNELVIEKRMFIDRKYGGTKQDVTGVSNISFPVEDKSRMVINKDTALVFLDGIRINNKVSSVFTTGDTVNIVFNESLYGRIEVFIDSVVKYTNSYLESGDHIQFFIDESFIDPIHGPINNANCIFFIDGKRVSNKYVNQIGRLNFEYESDTVLTDARIDIIYGDSGLVDDERYKLYGDDYFIYNMVGTQRVKDALKYGSVGNGFILDNRIGYRDILNKHYDYQETLSLINTLNQEPNVDLRIMRLLNERRSLIKDFLEEFTIKPVMKKHILSPGYTGQKIWLGSNRVYDRGTVILRMVYVNGKAVYIKLIDTDLEEEYYKLSINRDFFNVGENDIEIVEIQNKKKEKSYREVEIFRNVDTFGNISYRAEVELFGNITTVEDLKLLSLVHKDFDPTGVYLDNSIFGFKLIDYPTIIAGNKIIVDFGPEDPRIDLLVITSTKHFDYIKFIINGDGRGSLFNTVSIGHVSYFYNNEYHDVAVPLLHTGDIYLIDNNRHRRLFIGTDFIYRSHLDNPDIRQSCFIMRQRIPSGTVIELGVIPIYTKSVDYPNLFIEDTGPDKYGLLYLGNLSMPYSHEYVTITCNDKRINRHDISILSSKLIRLDNEEQSFQNLNIEMNFDTPLYYLTPFISLYNDTQFERTIADIFKVYNFSLNGIQEYEFNREETDSIYESFVDGVDTNSKTPNPIRTVDYIRHKYDLFANAYMEWYMSDHSNHLWTVEDIDPQVIREISIYLGVEQISESGRRDVLIYPWKNNLITNYVRTTEGYRGLQYSTRVVEILKLATEKGIPIKEAEKIYSQTMYGNRVYRYDIAPIKPWKTIDSENDIVIGRGPIRKL